IDATLVGQPFFALEGIGCVSPCLICRMLSIVDRLGHFLTLSTTTLRAISRSRY
ncbi:hypothetical protein BC831DRAFT_478133, partial [Entophlyctis helioformis]